MTWGRENNPSYPYYEHQKLTIDAYNTMANTFDTKVAPVGVAWKKVRDDNDAIHLYDSDGTHPSYSGSYLAACVFYATIFNKSPVGLTYTGSLTPLQAQYLQLKAFAAYNEYIAFNLNPSVAFLDSKTDVFSIFLNTENTLLHTQSNTQIDELTIQGITGKKLIKKKLLTNNDIVDVSILKNGLYIVQARIDNTIFVQKIIINTTFAK